MIITKSQPFTLKDIKKLKDEFDFYIKIVIDIKKSLLCRDESSL